MSVPPDTSVVSGPIVGPSGPTSAYPSYEPIIYSVWLVNGTLITRPSGFPPSHEAPNSPSTREEAGP
jgi:hypothetical protein